MVLCKYGCGKDLHFEDSVKSESGIPIPLEEDGNPHNCPNRHRYDTVNKNEIKKMIEKMEKNLSKKLLDIQLALMRLEGQKTLDQT